MGYKLYALQLNYIRRKREEGRHCILYETSEQDMSFNQ
jgi:hypothetical protein